MVGLSVPGAAQADEARQKAEGEVAGGPSPEGSALARPLIVVSAGGISKGAYQAGVNWAVLNLLRLQRDGVDLGLAPHELVVATGASAGGINSLLATAEWAVDSTGVLAPPDSSLYWKVWTSVGVRELLPKWRDGAEVPDAESALSRRYFETDAFPMVKDALGAPSLGRGLRYPVATGYMLTETSPVGVSVSGDDRLSVNTIRSAAVLQAVPLAGGGVGYEPFPFPGEQGAPDSLRGFGSLVHPRLLTLASRGGARHDSTRASRCWAAATDEPDAAARAEANMESVKSLTLASAAFPYAWSPVQFAVSRELDADGWPPDHVGSHTPTWFVDGGAFDNNPVSLARELRERLHLRETKARRPDASRCWGEPPPPLQWDETTILFTDPDDIRHAREEDQTPDFNPANALDNLVGLALNFLATGRQYELEVAARGMTDLERGWVSNTDREFPIVGSALFSFGAFLARPFREYDFYVGVYDGYVYAARSLAQDKARTGDADVAARVRGLLDDSRLGAVDPVALAVSRRLLHEEHGPALGGPEPSFPDATARERVLFAVLELGVENRGSEAWFGPLMRGLRADTTAMDALDEMIRACEADEDAPCAAGGTHVDDLIANPHRFLRGVASEVLNFRRVVEDGYGAKATTAGMAALNVYIAADRPGLEVNRSAVPDYDDGLHGETYSGKWRRYRAITRYALPSRAVLSTGIQYAAWSLSQRATSRDVTAVLEVAPLRSTRVDRDGDSSLPSYSVHLGWDSNSSPLGLGYGVRAHVVKAYGAGGVGLGAELFLRAGHVLTIGVGATPFTGSFLDGDGREATMYKLPHLTVGLNDVGGLAFWASRMMR